MCSIFGCINRPKAMDDTLAGQHLLQYRGTDSSGVVVWDDARPIGQRLVYEGLLRIGTVDHLKSKIDQIDPRPTGTAAIGHNRYATMGDNSLRNVQPLVRHIGQPIAIAHNGDLESVMIDGRVHSIDETRALLQKSAPIDSTSDTELILHLFARTPEGPLADRIVAVLENVQGAYSLLFLTEDGHLIAARDPWGFRPLWWGQDDSGAHFFASEDFALVQLGVTPIREVKPGEIIIVSPTLEVTHRQLPAQHPSFCSFEHVYFAFPASTLGGTSVADTRIKLGWQLASEVLDAGTMPKIDFLSPVPDSGNMSTIGMQEFLRAMGVDVPIRYAMFRSHYGRRSFIVPGQQAREDMVDLKHIVNAPLIKGKSVGLVDDSIVRSTTIRRIIRKLRLAGALEVHVFIPAPRIVQTCPYGINIKSADELEAARHTLEQTRQAIGADSLHHLSMAGFRASFANPDDYCMACFGGPYPTHAL